MPHHTLSAEPEPQLLDLQFTRSEAEGFLVRVLASPVGSGAQHTFALPFNDIEIAALRNLQPLTTTQVRDLGERLCTAALGGDVRQVLLSALHMLDAQTRTEPATLLQIRLWLSDTPELASLPWELLYLRELGLHLALMPQVSLIRQLDVRRGSNLKEVTPPLTVLCVIAAPSDQEQFDAEAEWQRLQASFAEITSPGLVSVQRLPQATFAALAERLDTEPVHVLHFIGHGVFDPQSGGGAVIFEDTTGTAQIVGGDQLTQVLAAHASLRLVVLNACAGAQSHGEDAHVGVAQRLVTGGLPAVVAMQFLITEGAARLFAQEFYGNLSRGRVVDVAMQRSRQAIYAQPNAVEWATPVLFEAKGAPLRIAPAPDSAASKPGLSSRRAWLLAALALLLVCLAAVLFLNAQIRCAVGLSTCDAAEAVGAEPTVVTTEAFTPAVAPAIATELPAIARRPPITVGLASLLDCTDLDLRDTIQAGVEERLRNVDLLDTRVFVESIDAIVVDEPEARRYKGQYDIVVWGNCMPATDTVTERVTVTATLILVGDTLAEAMDHRVAQPDAVAVTLPVTEIGLIAEGVASILGYYGENEIAHSHQFLADFSRNAAPYLQQDKIQDSTIHWLVGNAYLEHPDLVLKHFPLPPDVNLELRNLAADAYDRALASIEPDAQSQTEGAIKQNQGWLFYRTSDSERASEKFLEALTINQELVSAHEGLALVESTLGADYSEVSRLCENLLDVGGVAQGTYCLARNEWEKGDWQKSLDLALYAVTQRPEYAPNYLFLAMNACIVKHQEPETVDWYTKFLDAYSLMDRWDTVGYEARAELVMIELRHFAEAGNRCSD